jgi:hypothetical protein
MLKCEPSVKTSQPHGSFRKAFMVVDCNEVKNMRKKVLATSEAPEPRAASGGPFVEKSSGKWITLFRRGSQMVPALGLSTSNSLKG